MAPFVARAPVRIDLAGGTLDIWPLCLSLPRPAVTVNAALDLPAVARAGPRPDAQVRLESRDLGHVEEHDGPAALARALVSGTTRLGLLARLVLEARPAGGVDLVTEATSPPGAGLGGSSALAVAVLGALLALEGRSMPPEKMVRVAQDLEAAEMRAPTGYQDFHPPLHGGVLALESRPGGVHVERLAVDRAALAARLRLVYTGVPHVSGITNWGVLKAFLDGDAAVRAALGRIAASAEAVRDRLRARDLDGALAAVVEEGAARRGLGPEVETPVLARLDAEARRAGAVGTKICGAGGGGCALVVLAPGREASVDAALAAGGWRLLPVRIPEAGLTVGAATGA